MSVVTVDVGKLCCDICPFIDCYEKGTGYQCHCYMDNSIELDGYCDNETSPVNCPLKTGLIVQVSMSRDGDLILGNDNH
jgi:hypothetical protein